MVVYEDSDGSMTAGEGPTASDAFDDLAERYAQEVESSPYHEHLAFPATTALIPDVHPKRILDAGCGTGVYTGWLLDRGADVVGIDPSEAMLERATGRIDAITEPEPTAAFEEQWPERYEKESRRPVFLCVRAVNEG